MIIEYLTYLLILSLNLYISYCIKKILVIFIMGRFRKKKHQKLVLWAEND